MVRTRIKICCIADIQEANLAIRAGAGVIGLVGPMPSGPGPITEDQIANIVPAIPPGISTFLLTSEVLADRIIGQYRKCQTQVIQLTDYIDETAYREIRRALPAVKLVQVIHVESDEDIDRALHYSQMADALLLDSGNPSASTKVLGGTGKVHDWTISRKIVEQSSKPVYLAGGLNPENVAEAIRAVKPFGVDVCSGLRTQGKLDERKAVKFVGAVNSITK